MFQDLHVCTHNPEHEAPLVNILHRMKGLPYPGDLGGATTAELQQWLHLVPMKHRWVAVSGDRVCGHVAVSEFNYGHQFPDQAHSLEIVRLFVDPAARSLGIGSMLMRHATNACQLLGRDSVLMVSDYLTDPLRLYRRLGWEEIGATVSTLNGDTCLVFTQPKPSLTESPSTAPTRSESFTSTSVKGISPLPQPLESP